MKLNLLQNYTLRFPLKTCIIITSFLFSLALSSTLVATFLYAYFFNNMQFHIAINNYGEAHVELILLMVLMVVIIFGFIEYLKSQRCDKRLS